MLSSWYRGMPHDCSGPSQSLSLCSPQLWEAGAERRRQLKAQRRSAHFRQKRQWSCADPGPVRSLSAFWGWKEKTSLPAVRPRLLPSSLPPPKHSLPSSPPPSLAPRFPSTLPASSTLQGLSQPRGEADCQRKPPIPLPASVVQSAGRDERGDGETETWQSADSLNPQTVICLFWILTISSLFRLFASEALENTRKKKVWVRAWVWGGKWEC